MVTAKLFDFEDAKAASFKYIEQSGKANFYRHMLEQLNSRFDYIFDVLKHEMINGDLKMGTSDDEVFEYKV